MIKEAKTGTRKPMRIIAAACAAAVVSFSGTALAAEVPALPTYGLPGSSVTAVLDAETGISPGGQARGITVSPSLPLKHEEPDYIDNEPVVVYGYYELERTAVLRTAPHSDADPIDEYYSGAVFAKTDPATYSDGDRDWYRVQLAASEYSTGYMPVSALEQVDFDPDTDMGVIYTDGDTGQTYAAFRQSDDLWSFTRDTEKTGCVLTTFAMLLNNLGCGATPRSVYDANDGNDQLDMPKVASIYNAFMRPAVDEASPYFVSYDENTGRTYVTGGEDAILNALERHPEGVLVYFKRGDRAHAILASKVADGEILYCDSGRREGSMIPFEETWCWHEHRMSFGSIAYMVAVD